MHAVEHAERDDRRADGRQRLEPNRRHAGSLERQDLLGPQHAGLDDADPEQPSPSNTARTSVVDAAGQGLDEPWAKRSAASLRSDTRGSGRSVADRQERIGEPSVRGQRLELLGRDGVVHAQSGGLGATQGAQVAAAAQALAEIARQRADVRPGTATQVDPNVGAVARRASTAEDVDRVDRHRAGRQVERLAGARGAVRGPPALLARAEGRWPLLERADEGGRARRGSRLVGNRRRRPGLIGPSASSVALVAPRRMTAS